jgi:hypothetical protein
MTKLTLLVMLAACSRIEPEAKTPDPNVMPPAKPELKIALAGVTLADDCADGVATKPTPPPAAPVKQAKTAPAADIAASQTMPSAGACADPSNCHGPSFPQQPCEQTSMQLSVRAADATSIKIKRIELLDSSGKVVDVLTAKAATRWETDKYIAWDETLAAKQELVASYKLSSPAWDKISKGRWNAHTMTFQLRVTVTADGADRTIEKTSITPAMLEPPVAT